MASRTLCWFRADLRLRDNPAFHDAWVRGEEGVVAVFVLCPGQWREHDLADLRVGFLLRSLRSLARDLAELGVPLKIRQVDRFDQVPAALSAVAEETGCGALYFNREYEWNEQHRDERVAAAFRAAGRRVVARDDQTLVPPGTLVTKAGGSYTVFTPFRRRWLAHIDENGLPDPLPKPEGRRRVDGVEPDPLPRSVPGFDLAQDLPSLWPAGEAEAHRRLEQFLEERAADYPELRDRPDREGTSTLAPYLAVGAISAVFCVAAAARSNGGQLVGGDPGLEAWSRQWVWREFYRDVMVSYPRVSRGMPFRRDEEAIEWRDDPAGFDAWCQGRTGVPMVDAGMRQLLATGWMHNRLRMVTAMFLTKHLLIDWRRGESWFMRHLIDGDLANNNGGWQWSASTGTDAVPYFRIFQPFTQGARFDPDGEFLHRYLPELRSQGPRVLHHQGRLAAVRGELGYPEPLVDLAAARKRALAVFSAWRKSSE